MEKMMNGSKLFSLTGFVLALFSFPAWPLSLKQAVDAALEKSPDIRVLENQHDSARARARQALAPAEPSFQAASQDMTAPFKLSAPTSTVYQITQTFGFPGRALLNRSALSFQADAIASQGKAMRLQIAANVKQTYYQLSDSGGKSWLLNQKDQKLRDSNSPPLRAVIQFSAYELQLGKGRFSDFARHRRRKTWV